MNNAETILMQMKEARELVLSICGYDEEELSQMQFTAAFECLEKVLGSDEYGITELPKTTDFWIWWKDQWYRRDRIFLDRLRFDAELQKYTSVTPGHLTPLVLHEQRDFRYIYSLYHRVATDNIYINSAGMEYSFHNDVIKHLSRNT